MRVVASRPPYALEVQGCPLGKFSERHHPVHLDLAAGHCRPTASRLATRDRQTEKPEAAAAVAVKVELYGLFGRELFPDFAPIAHR